MACKQPIVVVVVTLETKSLVLETKQLATNQKAKPNLITVQCTIPSAGLSPPAVPGIYSLAGGFWLENYCYPPPKKKNIYLRFDFNIVRIKQFKWSNCQFCIAQCVGKSMKYTFSLPRCFSGRTLVLKANLSLPFSSMQNGSLISIVKKNCLSLKQVTKKSMFCYLD